ncbi:dihydrofolate reductase [Halobacteriovorax marinus]|uniref:dihydrofolate reductase n=1 Tax=Halobacteriovorax marinus TaxID=97084 RepID=UPI003A907F93
MISYFIVAGMGRNRELGLSNKLLWHLPEDLKNFKRLTIGKSMIMGRKTFESIGRPLPKRETIILTRDKNYSYEGCKVFHSMEEIEDYLISKGETDAAVVGGGEIYKLYLPKCSKMYLSYVDFAGQADTFFPEFDDGEWVRSEETSHEAYENFLAWEFVELSRK